MDKKLLIDEMNRLGITPSVVNLYAKAITPQAELKAICTSLPEITQKMGLTAEILSVMFPSEVLLANHVYISKQDTPPVIQPKEIAFFFGDAHGIIGKKGGIVDENENNQPYIKPAQGYFFEFSTGEGYGNAQCFGYNSAHLKLHDQSASVCYQRTTFTSDGNSNVRIHGQSKGEASERSSVIATGETFINGIGRSMTYLNGNSAGVFGDYAWSVVNGNATCLQMGRYTNIELNDQARCLSLGGGYTECHENSLVFSDNLENIKCIDIKSVARLTDYRILRKAAEMYMHGDRTAFNQILEMTQNKNISKNRTI